LPWRGCTSRTLSENLCLQGACKPVFNSGDG
jgi:hypothetical protein